MKFLKGRVKGGSFEHEEQFLLDKVWNQLCGKGDGREFTIEEKISDTQDRKHAEHHCSKRDDDDEDEDESVGADAVTVKLLPRPISVPSLHHFSHPNPLPFSQSLPSTCSNQDLIIKIKQDSRMNSIPKLTIGAGKDTVAVWSDSSSNGSSVVSDTVTGLASGTSQSTRLALVDAAAAIARRRAATIAVHVHVDKEFNHTNSNCQPQQQQQALRQPLRSLPPQQEQSAAPHNLVECRIHSPDKHDPKSVLEKRIGAMR